MVAFYSGLSMLNYVFMKDGMTIVMMIMPVHNCWYTNKPMGNKDLMKYKYHPCRLWVIYVREDNDSNI